MRDVDYMNAALKAERWISTHATKTDEGLAWALANEAPETLVRTLYAGSAGIALFYLELYKATGDSNYLDIARSAALDIVAYVKKKESLTCSCLGGWGGYMFVLHEIARATGDSRFTDVARFCAERLLKQSSEIGNGIGWVARMPYTREAGLREIYDVAEGAAGVGLYYLYAHDEAIDERALQWVTKIADRLLEVAKPARGGLRWQLMEDIPWAFDAPNFAHGTAGVAYFMARCFEATGEQKYLDAAIAGAGHVQAMAEAVGDDAHLVPHILDDGKPHRYYLGFCHGPAGTARLFFLLADITGDAHWMAWSRGLDKGLAALGAPETRGDGFWNNISQCCCDAGIGDHALWMFRATGDGTYLDLAKRVANELVRRADGDGDVMYWPQAEHRTQPEFIQAQTGYMQGAAGVASFFVHLASTLEGEPVKILFPESPYRRLLS